MEYKIAEEFLANLKKEFGKKEEEIVKAVKLRRLEQGRKIIEEFIQEFRKVTRESKYKERLLTEKFKWEINNTIWWRLMKSEY